jgi:hypothetical protein
MFFKARSISKHQHTKLLFSATFLLVLPFFQCAKPVKKIDRAFYHWKSSVKLSAPEKRVLNTLQVNTLYLKLFDVTWNNETKQPIPVAKLSNSAQELAGRYQIIPTVFITNECIQKLDSSQINMLALKVYTLVKDICAIHHIDSISELQIDCDWTASTRDKYFSMLKRIKRSAPNTILSATIRLHQVKYVSANGIPPVDRGLLMCYNMGNLKNPATKNSIIDPDEFKKYISNLAAYPLYLDAAFSLFEWKVLFRRNEYQGLIQQLPDEALNPSFCRQDENRTEILKDTLLYGYDLKKGDLLRSEKSNINDILSLAREINLRLKNPNTRVALYHLDSVTLNKYSSHELESIYSCFR